MHKDIVWHSFFFAKFAFSCLHILCVCVCVCVGVCVCVCVLCMCVCARLPALPPGPQYLYVSVCLPSVLGQCVGCQMSNGNPRLLISISLSLAHTHIHTRHTHTHTYTHTK